MLPKIVSDKLSKLDSKVSDIWNYFRTMSDGRRQTESLLLIHRQHWPLLVVYSVFSLSSVEICLLKYVIPGRILILRLFKIFCRMSFIVIAASSNWNLLKPRFGIFLKKNPRNITASFHRKCFFLWLVIWLVAEFENIFCCNL